MKSSLTLLFTPHPSPGLRLLRRFFCAAVMLAGMLLLTARPAVAGLLGTGDSASSGARVGATNSWLEACALETLGPDGGVVRLSPPGQCPGHFDLSPAVLGRLKQCNVLLRFDFQQGMDAKLAPLTRAGLRVVPVAVEGGLCEPASYRAACARVGRALAEASLADPAQLEAHALELSERLEKLELSVMETIRAQGLAGAPVLSSAHQAAFCRWLGLEVAAEFRGGTESLNPRELEAWLEAGRRARVRAVVANRPEGAAVARKLAEALQAPVVIFANFPTVPAPEARAASPQGPPPFDRMVLENVAGLSAALGAAGAMSPACKATNFESTLCDDKRSTPCGGRP